MPAITSFRVATRPGLPLTVLIECLEERVEVAKAHDERSGVGCLAELLEQTIPHLKKLERIEASGA